MRRLLLFLVRWLGETLVRLYYPRREVTGQAVPPGPVVFVANHPNGLLDPLLLRVATGRPARFLAKRSLFSNPFGRLAMDAFGCFPVARAQDGPAKDARARANEETFARCREALFRGEAVALFPEGTSHSDSRMRPLKTGAARIALEAAREATRQGGAPIAIVPVGLTYDRKSRFRSGVLITIGAALDVATFLKEQGNDDHEVETLTEAIGTRLAALVLQARTSELREGVIALARWTIPAGTASGRAQRQERARQLIEVLEGDAAASSLNDLVERVDRYARTLRRLGVRNPWALDLQLVTWGSAVTATLRLVVALPFAFAGVILGWVPYRLAGVVAPRFTQEDDVLGTVKLLGGALFVTATWIAEAIAAALLWGRDAAGGTLVAAAVLALAIGGGYVALCFEQWAHEAVAALRYTLIRRRRSSTVANLVAHRQRLVDDVTDVLGAPRAVGEGRRGAWADWAALAEKYEALHDLRVRRDRDEAQPAPEVLRRWSSAFPGCLRELDRLSADELADRARALRTLLGATSEPEAAEVPVWLPWISRYHTLLRDELARPRAKARLTARGGPGVRALRRLAEESGASEDEVKNILFPPRRRA